MYLNLFGTVPPNASRFHLTLSLLAMRCLMVDISGPGVNRRKYSQHWELMYNPLIIMEKGLRLPGLGFAARTRLSTKPKVVDNAHERALCSRDGPRERHLDP